MNEENGSSEYNKSLYGNGKWAPELSLNAHNTIVLLLYHNFILITNEAFKVEDP